MHTPSLLPRRLGDRALLVRLGTSVVPARWAAADEVRALPGLVESVPGGSSVMLRFEDAGSRDGAARAVASVAVDPDLSVAPRTRTVDVVYDGEDLAECAGLLGMSPEALIAAHSERAWSCAFLGFAPGFAYLRRPTDDLVVPRRPSPRTLVPAGSIGLAGAYSAVYPRSSPGGWQLIGRTAQRMWDPVDTVSPSYVAAGDRVMFRPTRDSARIAPDPRPAVVTFRPARTAIRVDRPGLQAVVTDLGRAGWTRWGVSRSGAMDRGAHRAANRLVSNPADAATLEVVTAAPVVVSAHGELVVAVTGGHGDLELTRDDSPPRPVPPGTPVLMADGARLTIGAASAGVRAYVAVRGGIDAPAVLGSRSTDTLGGLGVAPLASGDVVGIAPARPGSIVASPETQMALPATGEEVTIRIRLGPDDDLFDDSQVDTLLAGPWRVTSQSDRVGMRLAGPTLRRRDDSEIESQGLVRGAIQVPAHGHPIIFQADHPVTGGYPVIGVVEEQDFDVLAQTPAGAGIRFVLVGPRAATSPTEKGMPWHP